MEWRAVEGFPNYSVSDSGAIMNTVTGKTLKCRKAGNGYYKVTLCCNGKHTDQYVHRLVAETYIPNDLRKSEVNHIDGNKRNNTVSNLEWATRAENMQHLYNKLDSTEIRRRMGLSRRGKNNKASHRVMRIEDGKIYPCISDAAKDIGVHRMCVSDVCRGIQKTTKGYHYMYADIGGGMVDKENKE